MIDAHQVEEPTGGAYPLDPEAETLPRHFVPVVEGIAPQLARGREIVRGYS